MTPENFRKKRLQLGLTQEKLAEKLRVSISFISQIERGKKKPSWKVIDDLIELVEQNSY